MGSDPLFFSFFYFIRHRHLGRAAEASFKELFDSEESTFTNLGVEGYAIAVHAMNQC